MSWFVVFYRGYDDGLHSRRIQARNLDDARRIAKFSNTVKTIVSINRD